MQPNHKVYSTHLTTFTPRPQQQFTIEMRVAKAMAFSLETNMLLTVQVGVGMCQKSFSIHESFLLHRSEFFRRAMNGNWTEANTRTIKLPEDDANIFALYANLVYTDRVATSESDVLNGADHTGDAKEAIKDLGSEVENLIRLYVLAEKLCDRQAKNSVLEAMVDVYDSCAYSPNSSLVCLIYENTPPCSPGRKLMADIWSNAKPEALAAQAHMWPKKFLVDLAVATLAQSDRSTIVRNYCRLFQPGRYREVVRCVPREAHQGALGTVEEATEDLDHSVEKC